MKIVVLDGYTLSGSTNDVKWNALSDITDDYHIYDFTPPEQVVERAQDAEIILTNKTVLSKETLLQLPKLKYIGVTATGYNVVDLIAARDSDITVTNVPNYDPSAVAEMVFALLFELTRHVSIHANSVRAGDWSQQSHFSYHLQPLTALRGLTMGIIGLGHIGQQVARIAQAFNMDVIAAQRTPQAIEGIQTDSVENVFKNSDVISLHCPLTTETRHIVNARRLALMKSSALLINTGRGDLVDERALARALHSNQIMGAGLDVLSQEPPSIDNPLLSAPRCIITPHIAWATRATRQRILSLTLENITAYLAATPKNVVN